MSYSFFKYLATIIGAIALPASTAYVGYVKGSQEIEKTLLLESSKKETEDRNLRLAHFRDRCTAMESLRSEINKEIEGKNDDFVPDKDNVKTITPALKRWDRLGGHGTVAKSYFGEVADLAFSKTMDVLRKRDDIFGPEKVAYAALAGLNVELKSCNGPNSFPIK